MPERNTEPVDELGRLADKLLTHLETLIPEDSKVRAVILLEENNRCLTALGGWDSDIDAIAAVFAHMAAVFEANGKKLIVVPVGHD